MIKNCSISMLILNLAGCNLFTVQSSKYLSKNLPLLVSLKYWNVKD